MKDNKSIKALKKQMAAAVAMVLVAAIALGSSTYAWFVNNTMVKTKDIALTAKTAYALLISEGAEGANSAWQTVHTMEHSSNAEMVPVSTTGKNQTTPMTFVKQNEWVTNASTKKSEVNTYSAATANTEYLMESFEIKASQACKLVLDQDTVFAMADGVSGSTLGKTLRLALVVAPKTGATAENTRYFFYTIDDEETAGKTNTTLNGTEGADGLAKAIRDGSAAGTDAVDVISCDNLSNDNKVKKLATVTGASASTLVTTIPEGVDTLYTFTKAEEVCTVKAYIWIEGCDHDTVAANITTLTQTNTTSNAFKATLGFCAAQ